MLQKCYKSTTLVELVNTAGGIATCIVIRVKGLQSSYAGVLVLPRHGLGAPPVRPARRAALPLLVAVAAGASSAAYVAAAAVLTQVIGALLMDVLVMIVV